MGTTTFDNDVFWFSSEDPSRLRRIGRRLRRRSTDPFDRPAQRKLAAVFAALARHGEALEPEPRR